MKISFIKTSIFSRGEKPPATYQQYLGTGEQVRVYLYEDMKIGVFGTLSEKNGKIYLTLSTGETRQINPSSRIVKVEPLHETNSK